jgi:hypothetical protein
MGVGGAAGGGPKRRACLVVGIFFKIVEGIRSCGLVRYYSIISCKIVSPYIYI